MLLEAVSTLSIRWFEPYRRCEALLQGRTFPAACWSEVYPVKPIVFSV